MKRLLELFDLLSQLTKEEVAENMEGMYAILTELQEEANKFDPKQYTPEELDIISDKAKASYAHLTKVQSEF